MVNLSWKSSACFLCRGIPLAHRVQPSPNVFLVASGWYPLHAIICAIRHSCGYSFKKALHQRAPMELLMTLHSVLTVQTPAQAIVLQSAGLYLAWCGLKMKMSKSMVSAVDHDTCRMVLTGTRASWPSMDCHPLSFPKIDCISNLGLCRTFKCHFAAAAAKEHVLDWSTKEHSNLSDFCLFYQENATPQTHGQCSHSSLQIDNPTWHFPSRHASPDPDKSPTTNSLATMTLTTVMQELQTQIQIAITRLEQRRRASGMDRQSSGWSCNEISEKPNPCQLRTVSTSSLYWPEN
jgi:hypothetical protein